MKNIEPVIVELQQLFNANEYAKAKELLFHARDQAGIHPADYAELSQLLGRIFFYESDLQSAKCFFLEAIQQNPADTYSKIFLGRIIEQSGDRMTALKIFAACYDEKAPFVHIGKKLQEMGQSLSWKDLQIGNLLGESAKPLKRQVLPKFSILVLGYNKAAFTIRCLEAIFANTDYPNYELIVVDNASVDETPGMLETYGHKIKFIHSNTNLGFVGGNNRAAQYAAGDFIVFLNNDTEPQPGWLTEISEAFQRHARVGAVGAMLLYPNGTLQEAGGTIFQDATGWNYGRNENPLSSRFRFAREVDYCSGAALAVRADLFRRLGGFDLRYAPAYCEDTDLCFSVRKLGYRVLYCPTSRVIHHEGITSGTDVTKGFKKYQVVNTPKFRAKWSEELARQSPADPSLRYQFSHRHSGKRILIIDDLPPLPDRAAGSLRMYHTVKQMLSLGYKITYVHLTALGLDDAAMKHMGDFRSAGVELIWFEYERWWEIRNTPHAKNYVEKLVASLELPLRKFDLAYICFWHIAGHVIDHIRKADPALPIMIDSMDLHYVREARQAETLNDTALRAKAKQTKKMELDVYAKADAVTTVTEHDREILKRELPNKAIFIMTDVHDPVNGATSFEQRDDFLFVGNFNHNPNEDGVLFFVREILPHIKKALPRAKLWIVGNNPTAKVKALAGEDVVVTGWVPEVRPYLQSCRVSVVPLRYGAGNKGKVGETLSYGVPMVSTTIGAEGMGIVDGQHAFIADDPAEFARRAVRLYSDRELWTMFAQQGKQLVASQYSSHHMRRRIQYVTSFTNHAAFKSYRAVGYATPPRASIIVLAHNQFEYTRQCLESIRSHTRISHETILVDNASTDGTAARVVELFPEVRLIRNTSNVGFPAGVNQGINAALGDDVVLLNNDTIVTEGWLERMFDVAESNDTIGIVGPISNYVSGVQIDRSASYANLEEMHRYARKIALDNKGMTFEFPRVAFLCTLIKRKVIDMIGGLDERFTPGNYEDDDFCLRVKLAGFTTVIAKDVFIHHFGSKSFAAEGLEEYTARLSINQELFRQKWSVDAERLWTVGGEVKKRSLKVPLNGDAFVQHFEQAHIHIEMKEMGLALESLKKALDLYHRSPRNEHMIEFSDVLHLAGSIALAMNELETARHYFEEELKLLPNSSEACTGLGEVFFLAEMDQAAKTMFEHAVANDDKNLAAQQGLAKVNNALGLAELDNSLERESVGMMHEAEGV